MGIPCRALLPPSVGSTSSCGCNVRAAMPYQHVPLTILGHHNLDTQDGHMSMPRVWYVCGGC